MDEDLSIINSNTRNEKIKNFFLNNKKILSIFLFVLVVSLIGFFSLNEYRDKQRIKISNLYNSVIIEFNDNNKDLTLKKLINIVNKKDPTYSPLSLYFIIDNQLTNDFGKINELFDILINQTSVENEIKNLIIYKKALFNADRVKEDELLNILNPLINSKSVWKSHGLYLIAEYYFFKNEKQKSKEFFNLILSNENTNQEILRNTQLRLNRDFSE